MSTFAIALQHEQLRERAQHLRSEIRHLERQLGGDAEADRLRRELAQARDRRQDLERRLREVDRDTELRRERAGVRERELMNPHALNPNALIRLRDEVDHLKQALSGAEDAELALLEQADAEDAQLRSLELQLNERIARAAELVPELEGRLTAARSEVEALDGEVATAWSQLPADWQRAIDGIHAHHPDAVAEVRDGLCQACHVAVTSSARHTLRQGELLRCDNCGRLLGES